MVRPVCLRDWDECWVELYKGRIDRGVLFMTGVAVRGTGNQRALARRIKVEEGPLAGEA